MSGLYHGFLSSCNVVVIVSPKFPCIGFDLNLLIPTYISTFFWSRQKFSTERQTGIYSI